MQIPDSFIAHTGRILATHRPAQGENSDVTILTGEQGRFVLKHAAREEQSRAVAAELRVLAAIADHYPFVPAPLAATPDMLLMTLLPGTDLVALHSGLTPVDKHWLLAEAAIALRRIHGWRPVLPPPSDSLLDLLARVGLQPEIVFAHGDYCLPNIMVHEGRVTAVIDWPHAGYMDRRIDLAAAVWSIRYNLKDESYVETFLHSYGYDGGNLPLFERIWQAL